MNSPRSRTSSIEASDQKGYISLVSPLPRISKPDFQGPWYDAAYQKLLYYADRAFYWFDPFANVIGDANIFAHGPVDISGQILAAKISLDNELIAVQQSSKEVLVVSTTNSERWQLLIKHPETNNICSPGIVWSDHGGKSQDLVILTERGLELYKVSILRGQCRLSRAMPQRATRYLYEPTHRILLLTVSSQRILTGGTFLEINGFFLRFDAFTDMPR
jgi:hypothetical protein